MCRFMDINCHCSIFNTTALVQLFYVPYGPPITREVTITREL